MKPLPVRLRELGRKPIMAALLSFFFPGLGQAAAGQRNRGLIVSVPMFTVIGAFLVILIFDRHSLLGLAVNQEWLTSLLILDTVALIYHLWAVVDSYLVAVSMQPRKRKGAAPSSGKWATVLGVFVILSGTVLIHGGVAQVDMDWQHALYCLTAKVPCYFADTDTGTFDPNASSSYVDDNPSAIAGASDSPGVTGSQGSAAPAPTIDFSDIPSFSTNADSQNWAADGELNILLAGLGVQKGGSAADLGPDTIMVAHIGVSSGKAELISVGRNNYCTPLPTQEIAAHYATSVLGCPAYTFGPELFNIPNEILYHCNKWPIPDYVSTCGQANDPNRYLRAYKGFEMTIGGLLGIHIDGSMWTNPNRSYDARQCPGRGDHHRDVEDGRPALRTGARLRHIPAGIAAGVLGDRTTDLPRLAALRLLRANGTCRCPEHGERGRDFKRWVDGHPGSTLGRHSRLQGQCHASPEQFGRRHHHQARNLSLQRRLGPGLREDRPNLPSVRRFRSSRQISRPCSGRSRTVSPTLKFASIDAVLPILNAVQAVPYQFNTDLDILNPSNLQVWAGMAKYITGNVQTLVLKPADRRNDRIRMGSRLDRQGEGTCCPELRCGGFPVRRRVARPAGP